MKIAGTALAVVFLSMMSTVAQAACPTFTYGLILTPAQWQSCFDGKQNSLGYTPVNKAGDVMTGRLVLPSPTGTKSSLNITPGSAPSLPSDGDMWMTTAGLYVHANGSTIGPLGISVGTGTSGGIPYFNTTTTQASSGLLTHYGIVYGGGAGGAPAATEAGALDQVLMGSATVPGYKSIGDCSATSSALTYSTGTHLWGCNASVVSGPASATANGFAVYDGTTGKIIKDHAATIDASSEISNVLPPANGGFPLAWTSWTPNLTANGGSPTYTSVTAKYMQVGKTVFFHLTFTIATAGTGYIIFDLPVAASGNNSGSFYGANVATAHILLGQIGTSTKGWIFDNGTYPGTAGQTITTSGFYETI